MHCEEEHAALARCLDAEGSGARKKRKLDEESGGLSPEEEERCICSKRRAKWEAETGGDLAEEGSQVQLGGRRRKRTRRRRRRRRRSTRRRVRRRTRRRVRRRRSRRRRR